MDIVSEACFAQVATQGNPSGGNSVATNSARLQAVKNREKKK